MAKRNKNKFECQIQKSKGYVAPNRSELSEQALKKKKEKNGHCNIFMKPMSKKVCSGTSEWRIRYWKTLNVFFPATIQLQGKIYFMHLWQLRFYVCRLWHQAYIYCSHDEDCQIKLRVWNYFRTEILNPLKCRPCNS